MVYTAVEHCDGPVAVRYPRGSALGVPLKDEFEKIEIGKSEKLTDGNDVALLALGVMVDYSMKAAAKLKEEGVNCEVINMRFAKPLDTDRLEDITNRHTKIVTLEENNLPGGFGSGIVEYFTDMNYKNDILRIGLPDGFVDHGTQEELHQQLGIDVDGIVSKVKVFCGDKRIRQEVTV